MKTELMEKMAGEIALSDEPGETIKKWREEFEISKHTLSDYLKLSPSVISDYEAGRRKSPGIRTIRRFVQALLELDEKGKKLYRRFVKEDLKDVILSIKEFTGGKPVSLFLKEIEAKALTEDVPLIREVRGYTVVDSLRAITSLGASDYPKIYGYSSERALVFTGVKYGRSPMVAIRANPLKPAMVVYVQPQSVDDLAVRLAELDNIILAVTKIKISTLIERLEKMT
ncbi:MAG: helix-turn-helix domain-containing protein [Thermoplasmata archaeon]|nr:helix-turn-helix domain-containing protein [Thermoplasmata archaeon]